MPDALSPMPLLSLSMTIFTRIINREIPAHIVYEEEHCLAFLDVAPLAPGHTLLIPKEPAPTLDRLSDDAAAAIGRALPRLCRAITKATGCPHYNVLQNNGEPAHQAVMHVHFHIIPKPTPPSQSNPQGLGINWPAGSLGDDAGQLAESIATALG